jgi:hypothetical protein
MATTSYKETVLLDMEGVQLEISGTFHPAERGDYWSDGSGAEFEWDAIKVGGICIASLIEHQWETITERAISAITGR